MLRQHCISEIANINNLLQLQAFVNETKSKIIQNKTSPKQVKYFRSKEEIGKRQIDRWAEGQTDGQTDRDRTKQGVTKISYRKLKYP